MESIRKERTFTLCYWQDDGWYVGRLLEVPSVFSQGETLKDLVENVEEVYRLMMEESQSNIPVSDYLTTTVEFAS